MGKQAGDPVFEAKHQLARARYAHQLAKEVTEAVEEEERTAQAARIAAENEARSAKDLTLAAQRAEQQALAQVRAAEERLQEVRAARQESRAEANLIALGPTMEEVTCRDCGTQFWRSKSSSPWPYPGCCLACGELSTEPDPAVRLMRAQQMHNSERLREWETRTNIQAVMYRYLTKVAF